MPVPREPYLISCFWPKFHTSVCNLTVHINCKCYRDTGSVLYSIDQPGISIYQNSYLPPRLRGTIFIYARLQTSGTIKKSVIDMRLLRAANNAFLVSLSSRKHFSFSVCSLCKQFISKFSKPRPPSKNNGLSLKQKKSSWGSKMNNTLLLFYSPKPRSQVWILIFRNWSIADGAPLPENCFGVLGCYRFK